VLLDNPHQSKGNNPDVLFTINGVRWGVACKVPNSENPLTMWDNFKKGLEQIQNSDAHRGFVLFNLKNLISLDEVWPRVALENSGNKPNPRLRAWPHYRVPVDVLRRKVDTVMADLVDALERQIILK
jgi:hypothetical protein